MRDSISVERIKTAHPKLREELAKACSEADFKLIGKAKLRLAYVIRTDAEQAALYAQGRTKLFDAKGKRLGIVTNAAPGWSCHNYGLGVDIVLLVDNDGDGKYEEASWDTAKDYDKDGKADWMEVVEVFKKYGWAWGGDWKFKDAPHFEKTFGYTIKQLIALKKEGKVDKEGYVLI